MEPDYNENSPCEPNRPEAALFSESDEFAHTLNAMPGCYLQTRLGERWIIEFANDELLQLLGFPSLSELLRLTGGFLENLVRAQDVDEFDSQMRDLLRSDQGHEQEVVGECRLRTSGRGQVWMRLEAKRSLEHGGDSVLVSFYDISEQKQANEKLALSVDDLKIEKADLEFILDQAPDGIYVSQLSSGARVVFISDSLCELIGYSRSEIDDQFGGDYSQVIQPNDRQIYLDAINELAQYPHEVVIGYRIVKKDGGTIDVTDAIKSARNSDGTMRAYAVVSLWGIGTELWAGASRLIECIAYPAACFALIDGDATLDIFNDAFCSLMRMPRARISALGKADPLFFLNEEESSDVKGKAEALVSGKDFVEADIHVSAWSKSAMYHVAGTVVIRRGGIIGIVCVIDTEKLRSAVKEEIRNELLAESCPPKVEVRTFGHFAVFVNGKPVAFHSGKARELLAFLVDRRGTFASSAEIISALWGDEPANKVTRARCRKTVMRLLDELKDYGVESIVETAPNGSRRVVPELLTCDYYEYLSGDPQYQSLFRGEYMPEYSWAETTLATLLR